MSNNKKLESPLSEDDLLAIAASSPEAHIKESDEPTQVHKFINKYKITPSEDKVWTGIIYMKYKEDGGKLDNRVFFKEFKKIFKSKTDGEYRYYLVDKEPFDMSEENFWKIMRSQKKEKLKKMKNKKIQKMVDNGSFEEFFSVVAPAHLKFKKNKK